MSFVIRSFVFPFHSLLFYSLSSFCLFSSSLFWIFFKSLAKLWRTQLPYAIPRQIVNRERPRTVLFPSAAAAPALPAASPAPKGTAPAAPGRAAQGEAEPREPREGRRRDVPMDTSLDSSANAAAEAGERPGGGHLCIVPVPVLHPTDPPVLSVTRRNFSSDPRYG